MPRHSRPPRLPAYWPSGLAVLETGTRAPALPLESPPMPHQHSASPSPNPVVKIGNVSVSNRLPLALFAGPCQLESRMHALEMAAALKEIADKLRIGIIYKASFDKANRTSAGAAARDRA